MKKIMFGSKLLAVLSAAVLCAAPLHTVPQSVLAADYSAVKSRVSVHDPSVFVDSVTDSYYVFGSHIDAAKSTDLQNWKIFTNGYNTPGNKIFGDLSGNLKKAFAWAGEDLGDCENGFAVWAPDVVWDPVFQNADGSSGAYLMYFCTSSDYRTSVIAYAAAQNPEGPYTFVDTIVYSGFTDTSVVWGNHKKVDRRYSNTNIQELIDKGEVTFNEGWFNKHNFNNQMYPNAIDPAIYYDTDGKMYMCYGSWSGGIFTLEIDPMTGKAIHPKTGQTEDGRMVDSYFGTKISGGYGKSGEGPFIEYNEDTGYYYLWVTYGELTSTGGYNMRVARSTSPTGPFVDAAGRNMVLEPNPNLDSIGLKVMTNYYFSSLPRAYMACGHNSVLKDYDGKWYLLNHARFDDGSEYHEVRVHAMNFNEAGWPVVMPYEYSGDAWPETGYEPAELAGTYEFINHGNATNGTITKAEKITLNADGTISGAVTGTWKEADETAVADITINKVVYKGYFAAQYDETGKGNRVMTFTAVGNNNQTIWGVGTNTWNGTERSALKNRVGSGKLYYDKNAVCDTSGGVFVCDTLLSNVPYTITNVNSGLVLESPETAPDALDKNGIGASMQQWAKRGNKSGDANQDFRITELAGGWCKITSMVNEDWCLTVSKNSADNGVTVHMENGFTGSDTQLWQIVKRGGYYGIVSKCSDGTAGLDVYEWSKENGGEVKQWEFWGGECQLWKITPTYATIPDGWYTIRNVENACFLACGNGEVFDYVHEEGWEFKRTDGGFTICYADGNALTLAPDKENKLTLAPNKGDDTQIFDFWCNADGSYSIIPKALESMKNAESVTLQKYVLAPTAARTVTHIVTLPETTETTTETTTTATETTVTESTATEATVMETSATEARTTGETAGLRGDVNCDKKVTVADAILLARIVAEDKTATVSEQGKRNAELDGKAGLSADDTTMLVKAIAGLAEL